MSKTKRKYDKVVYMITNEIDGMKYIGASAYGLAVRKAAHKTGANKGKKSPLHDAIRDFGFCNFKWKVLKKFQDMKAAIQYEKFVINKIGLEKLYNTHDGDHMEHKVSEETKKKLSKSKLGNKNPMYGKKLSDKVKKDLLKASMEVCCKKVIRISDGEEYVSISDCAKCNNLSIGTVSLHANNKVKKQRFKFI